MSSWNLKKSNLKISLACPLPYLHAIQFYAVVNSTHCKPSYQTAGQQRKYHTPGEHPQYGQPLGQEWPRSPISISTTNHNTPDQCLLLWDYLLPRLGPCPRRRYHISYLMASFSILYICCGEFYLQELFRIWCQNGLYSPLTQNPFEWSKANLIPR